MACRFVKRMQFSCNLTSLAFKSHHVSFFHTRLPTPNTLLKPAPCCRSFKAFSTSPKIHAIPPTVSPTTPSRPLSEPSVLRKTLGINALKPRENIYTIPNILTVSRLFATPLIGYFIVSSQPLYATSLFLYAGLTDLLDGWLARRFNQQTVVGTIIDPLADKTLMTVLTICLAVQGALPLWLATLILGRDISLAIAAIYYRYASLPAPKTFARYWDFSLPSAEVHPTSISKANTALQLMLIGGTIALPLLGAQTASGMGVSVSDAVSIAQYVVAGTTAWSGLSYLYTKNAVTILGQGSDERKKIIIRNGRAVIGASFLVCLGVALALEQ